MQNDPMVGLLGLLAILAIDGIIAAILFWRAKTMVDPACKAWVHFHTYGEDHGIE